LYYGVLIFSFLEFFENIKEKKEKFIYFKAIYCKAMNSNVKINITSPSPNRR